MSKRLLGKRPARVDPRTLAARPYIAAAVHEAPARCSWVDQVDRFGLYKNDEIGDCTIATAAHLYEVWSAVAHDRQLNLKMSSVLEAYSAVGGYVPGDESTDNGAVVLDVLKHWRSTGIGTHKIEGFASLNPQDRGEIRAAVWLFGGAYAGVGLPLSAQEQVGDEWDVVSGADSEPWSWGGHAMAVAEYDSRGVSFITWGEEQRATWRWVEKYMDEAYAVIAPRWLKKFRSPVEAGHFRLSELRNDLKALAR